MNARLIAPLLATLVAIAACGGGGGTTPTPTVTPSSTVAVTPVPLTPTLDAAALDRADQLYYEGYFEEAMDLYAAAAKVSQLRPDALWSLAVAQFSRGMRDEASASINEFLDEDLAPDRERQAVFLLGVIEASQGSTGFARKPLETYIGEGGAAAPYASARLAQIAAKDGDYEEAIAFANEAIAGGLSPGSETGVRFSLAGYYEEMDDIPAAIEAYTGLSITADTSLQRANALWRLAEVAYTNGYAETARQALARLVLSYPSTGSALDALSHPGLTFGVSTFDRAVVLFLNRVNSEATAAFDAFLAEGPSARDAANAHHHLGILSERALDYDSALVHYETAIALLADTPSDTVAADAMWDRALVLHLLGRLDDAVDAYVALADNAPFSAHVLDALFAAGLVRYQQGLAGDALHIFELYLDAAPDADSISRAEYWLGKAHDLLGDPAGLAVPHYQAAEEIAPTGYYGMRARAVLDGASARAPTGEPQTVDDWTEVEQWLASVAGPEDTLVTDALFGPAWDRALELRDVGLTLESDDELIAIRDGAIGKPWLLYRLARAADDERIAWLASRAAGILASAYADPPRALLTLNYPLEFFDIVSQEADANGLSPYLILGLMRQESLYDPAAFSPAGASGLMQIISPTAAQIASELGDDAFTDADLLRPYVNIRYGAYYLASTLDLVDGSVPAALSGYNGGPGNAIRWLDQSGGDPDVFLEIIDFTETAAYVELVLENYALYLYAYGHVGTPSLPLS